MTDLTEQTLLDAIRAIKAQPSINDPHQLVVTDAGIALQARRYYDGELTVLDMVKAGVPTDVIAAVIETANEMLDQDAKS